MKEYNNSNKLQNQYTWLPKVNSEKKYNNPWAKEGKLSVFNYDQKLKDLIADMVIYVTINSMVKKGIFKRNNEETCREIYSEIISEATYKVLRGIGNWNTTYDICLFVNLNVQFAFSTYFFNKKNEPHATLFSELSEEQYYHIAECMEKDYVSEQMYLYAEELPVVEPQKECTEDYDKPVKEKKKKDLLKIKNHLDARTNDVI